MGSSKRKRTPHEHFEDASLGDEKRIETSMDKSKANGSSTSNKEALSFRSDAHREWNQNFKFRLPQAAKEKNACQKKWPVQLDHCFGRIILDSVIGVDQPWTAKLKGPAIRNMTESQANECNQLAEKILSGDASLVDLDEKSLALRGKRSKAK